jgi:hypothetical protein
VSSVVIAAGLAQRPGAGGHAWFALQYLLGFRRLGWDVLLVDRLDDAMCHDGVGRPCPAERSVNLRYLAAVMEGHGLRDCWTVLLPEGGAAGVSRAETARRLAESDFLLNVMGYLEDEDLLSASPLRVFLDIDPGFGQMWRELGQCDLFAGHDRFVSVGLNVGDPECAVPDCGLPWIPTVPPVALDEWSPRPGGTAFTTVASWRGPYDPVEYGDRTYGLRVHEFRRFLDLPARTSAEFELAMAIDPAEAADLRRLAEHGWPLVDPRTVAGDPFSYKRFIERSLAEFTVAKGMYVDTRSGWFSDRSACYLASGKPVIAQETGFGAHLPAGEGLLAFSTPEQAAAAVEAVMAEPQRHARAARELAEEHFAADRVLPALVANLEPVHANG